MKIMTSQMEIEVMNIEIVKPSSPTPDNRRVHKFSTFDQISPAHRTPVLLFFLSKDSISISERSQILTTSLSQTLSRFYPFAGRLRGNFSIECNDEGAEFAVARVNCPMSRILENPDPSTLSGFVPSEVLTKDELFTSPLLLVKASFFTCGGSAIGVCLSHKAGDASTLSTFLNTWAATASKSELEREWTPQFISSSIFPPEDCFASFLDSYQEPDYAKSLKVKRLLFRSPRIDALRSKAGHNSTVQNPTRVEAVTALIWKCATEALKIHTSYHQRASVLIHTANIRNRVEPSLPENAAGNLTWLYLARTKEIEMKDMVVAMRRGVEELKASCKSGIQARELRRGTEEIAELRKVVGTERYSATSWCRFPMYGVDFGWGKPVWVCVPNIRMKNLILMMDTRDGRGIEVLVCLDEQEMKHFENNHELLDFASFDRLV